MCYNQFKKFLISVVTILNLTLNVVLRIPSIKVLRGNTLEPTLLLIFNC